MLHKSTKKYPTGELQVNVFSMDMDWQEEGGEVAGFDYYLEGATADEIMEMLFVVDASKREGEKPLTLFIKFFPYARQDRVCSKGEAFSLKVMADLVNNLGFQKVVITEPHSNVLGALVNNLEVIYLADRLENLPDNKVIIAPDAGAEKRAFDVAKMYKRPLVTALKRRNPVTGAIDKTEVFCDDLNKQECLIVDDICDGGRTFIELAKVLKQKNAGKISLVVAHGIFSNGVGVFKDLIDEIFCLDENNKLRAEF